MGKGDLKTAKGKRFKSSFGKSRPKKKAGTKLTIPISKTKKSKIATPTASKTKKSSVKKTEEKTSVKKPAAKKSTKKVEKAKSEEK